MKKMVAWGITCCIVGLLLWGIVIPATIPGATGGDSKWLHIAEQVGHFSTGAGIVIGFGLALIVIGLIQRNN